MEAIILAGGLGTRLAHVVKDVPKPMAPVAGRPFLEYILDDLAIQGAKHIVLAVCYKRESIISHFGDSYRGIPIDYSIEDIPLYTGGAVKKAASLCQSSRVWVFNGDSYLQVQMRQMASYAEKTDAAVTIAVKGMSNFSRYGRVEMDDNGFVTAFCEKAPCEQGFINGGIYYLKSQILVDYPDAFSLEDDCFPLILRNREITAYRTDGYFVDIGVPDDYKTAQDYFHK